MKRFPLLLSFLLYLLSVSTQAQNARLRISNLQGFPALPLDTAQEGVSYDSIRITVVNSGTGTFTDNIDVFLQGGTAGQGLVDTLYQDSVGLHQIAPGDSIDLLPVHYQFRTVHFDDGDNIVVVWPAARTTGTPSDSISFHVYFVRLSAISEAGILHIRAYPNPSSQFITLDLPSDHSLKYVRILNVHGQEIYRSSSYNGFLPVGDLPTGLYLLEAIEQNGKCFYAKILKQ